MHRFLSRLRARWLGSAGLRALRAGRYDRAHALLSRGLALETGDGPDRAWLLNGLGMSCKHLGRYREGVRAYREGLAIARRLGPEHPAVASFLHNLGGLEHARGRHARGRPFAQRAVAIRERAHGPEHVEVARDVAALAAILDGLGRHAEAENLHRRALGVFRRRGERLEIAYVLGNLAACCSLQGRALEARRHAEHSLALKRRHLTPDHPDVELARSNLGVIERAGKGAAPCSAHPA
jgi:tetratricopeptide (TPR) repeat protein